MQLAYQRQMFEHENALMWSAEEKTWRENH